MTDPTEHDQSAEGEIDESPAAGDEPVAEPEAEEPTEPVAEPTTAPDAAEPTDAAETPALQESETPPESAQTELTGESAEVGPEAAGVDDVTAAVAAAIENVETEATFDDIAPGTVAAVEGEAAAEAVPDRSASTVSIWPFVVYDLFWAAFAGLLVWQFQTLPPGTPVYEAELYPTALLVGVILVMAGPLLILVSWIASWGKPGSTKGRLFISALIRGSVATLLGVTMWWTALIALDQIRLGTLL